MKNLRIATYNVNGLRARLPNLLDWLKREQPDIACLQELKSVDSAFPAAELEAAGYGDVLGGWLSIATWMIVTNDDCHCPGANRIAKDLAGVNQRGCMISD